MVAGGERSVGARARAEGLCRLARGRAPYPPWAWWARRGRRCCAAAMALPTAGRVGMLVVSPLGAVDVEHDAVIRVLQRVGDAALAGKMAFVQALTNPDAEADRAVLERAGFARLTELLYLSCDPAEAAVAVAADDALSWRTYGAFDDAELADVIDQTYEASGDCPALSGLRSMDDVIAGHKAGGTFRPAWWALAYCDQRPAGVVLANEAGGDKAEVVYMGVVPAFRGRGVGAALVGWAARQARAAGMERLSLAVDTDNACARSVYARFGFAVERRRVVHVRRREA